jgi:RNA recognition motif-containing protein
MPRVYIGNLASSVTSDDLQTLFARAGEVRGALAVHDKVSGLCRGFGFVDMVDAEDATVAIRLLDKVELNGQRILIEPVTLRESNGNTGKGAAKRRSKAKPAA